MARPREFDEANALHAVTQTFWKQGYQATSIKDLEEATGLTAGSLYKAYGSKRELFLLSLERYMKEESYLATLLQMFDSSLEQALRKLFDTIIESSSMDSERPSGCLVTNLASELLNIDAILGKEAIHCLGNMQKALQFRFKWAQEREELGKQCDIDALSSYFMIVIQGVLVISTTTKDVDAMQHAREIALATLH
jgi:TetR/AcrR family transcriptional regulator, transcriptional repressor for nem operon